MYERIETRVVDTGGAIKNELIQKNACCVHWITVSAEALGTIGLIQIYDGFDVDGKLKWQLEPGYSRHYNFLPPIPCDQGIFVYNNAAIASYTIGYHPVK